MCLILQNNNPPNIAHFQQKTCFLCFFFNAHIQCNFKFVENTYIHRKVKNKTKEKRFIFTNAILDDTEEDTYW